MPGMKATMDEWKQGNLHSGSKTGPVVKSQKQAVAIGLSEERKMGKKIPKPKHGPSENGHDGGDGYMKSIPDHHFVEKDYKMHK